MLLVGLIYFLIKTGMNYFPKSALERLDNEKKKLTSTDLSIIVRRENFIFFQIKMGENKSILKKRIATNKIVFFLHDFLLNFETPPITAQVLDSQSKKLSNLAQVNLKSCMTSKRNQFLIGLHS